MRPDPAGLAAVDMTNPQTWNRYAYVMNNPVTLTDPTGLHYYDCYWSGGCNGNMETGGGGGGGSSGYGGGGSVCNLDGQGTGCSNLGGLGSQAYAPCPNSFCSGFRNGSYVQYAAFANGGGGYFAYSGPGEAGDLYYNLSTAQAAGSLADFNAMVQSGVHQEWGNVAIQDDANGFYSFTEPEVVGPPCVEGEGCEGQQPLAVPDGTSLAGVQHSHPWVGGSGQFDYDVEQLMTGGYTFLDYVTGPSSNGSNWGNDPKTFVLNPNGPSVCQLAGPAQFGIQGCN